MKAMSQEIAVVTKKPRIVVYVSEELKDRLEALALKRNRTVSNLLATLAMDEVETAREKGEIE